MERLWKLVSLSYVFFETWSDDSLGIVGPPEDRLVGFEGVEGAVGPRFRKLSPQESGVLITLLLA